MKNIIVSSLFSICPELTKVTWYRQRNKNMWSVWPSSWSWTWHTSKSYPSRRGLQFYTGFFLHTFNQRLWFSRNRYGRAWDCGQCVWARLWWTGRWWKYTNTRPWLPKPWKKKHVQRDVWDHVWQIWTAIPSVSFNFQSAELLDLTSQFAQVPETQPHRHRTPHYPKPRWIWCWVPSCFDFKQYASDSTPRECCKGTGIWTSSAMWVSHVTLRSKTTLPYVLLDSSHL